MLNSSVKEYRKDGSLTVTAIIVMVKIIFISKKDAFKFWSAYDSGMMKGANVNTIRVYHDFLRDSGDNKDILDNFYKNGIMVIIAVETGNTGNDPTKGFEYIEKIVNAYKDHPAILFWSVGNEWNYNSYYNMYPNIIESEKATENMASFVQKCV